MEQTESCISVYRKQEVVFKAGDPGDCLYEILRGKVGVFAEYGTAEEKLLTELSFGETFGEMAMIEAQPRSATAIALEEGTTLEKCTWETLGTFFRERPAKVVVIMQQMGKRIRQLTEDYVGACRTIAELTEASKTNTQPENNWIDHNLRRYLDVYRAYQGSDSPGRRREL